MHRVLFLKSRQSAWQAARPALVELRDPRPVSPYRDMRHQSVIESISSRRLSRLSHARLSREASVEFRVTDRIEDLGPYRGNGEAPAAAGRAEVPEKPRSSISWGNEAVENTGWVSSFSPDRPRRTCGAEGPLGAARTFIGRQPEHAGWSGGNGNATQTTGHFVAEFLRLRPRPRQGAVGRTGREF